MTPDDGIEGGRILHVITSTQRRGAEVFASELVPELADLGCRGSLVALVAGDSGGLDVPALGSTRLGLGTLRRLRAEAAGASILVAHGSSTLPAGLAATVGRRAKLVYRSIGDPRFWATTARKRAQIGLQLRRADAVVALTDGARDVLIETYGLDADRVVVIPKGESLARAVPPAESAETSADPARLGSSAGAAPVVAYVGSLTMEKNLGLLIDALEPSEHRLLVIGDGADRDRLEADAGRRLGDRVSFVGSVPNPLVLLTAADVLAIPSLTEGMPGVAIEAGFAGIPVAATDVGWISEIVVDRVSGRLVPVGDPAALRSAIDDCVAHRSEYGRAGRDRCLERFEIGVVARRWADLLESV